MRLTFLLLVLIPSSAYAQGMDPDQNPHWTRYTFVEDSSALVPLQGDYRVFHLQSGMWWNYQAPSPLIGTLPEEGIRLLPMFDADLPAFRATPARGIDFPEEKLVVVRDRDTMIVELSGYYPVLDLGVNGRCERIHCERRPPMVMPFRRGWYLPNGLPFDATKDDNVDGRTLHLTQVFDRLWQKAEKSEHIIPQLNTDTCTQDFTLPIDLGLPMTTATPKYHDVWLMRSPYCGTHLVRFPSMGQATVYVITFDPYLPEQKHEPVNIRPGQLDTDGALVDVSDWPVGDHHVAVSWGGNGSGFTLKLR